MAGRLRVVIVDPQPIFRVAVRTELERVDAPPAVADAATVEQALPLIDELCTNVMLLEDAIVEAIADRRQPATRLVEMAPAARVVAIGMRFDPASIAAAARAGAHGFVSRCEPPADIVRAILSIAAGRTRFAPPRPDPPAPTPSSSAARALSRRHNDVLVLVAKGATNKQIGEALGVTPNTVSTYLKRIFASLGAATRAEALAIALAENLIRLD